MGMAGELHCYYQIGEIRTRMAGSTRDLYAEIPPVRSMVVASLDLTRRVLCFDKDSPCDISWPTGRQRSEVQFW